MEPLSEPYSALKFIPFLRRNRTGGAPSTTGKSTSILNTFRGRSRKWKIVATAVGLFLLIVIILLACIPKFLHKNPPPTSIIVPLYIYPEEGAWDPLYTAVDAHPQMQFLVIINPHDGPRNDTLLDPNYEREIPVLNSKQNVRTIGYVRTGKATRNISEVRDGVSIYASWATNKTANYQMHGIFFDETPNNYTSNGVSFMTDVTQFAKNQTGFGGVVHNPGSIPDDDRLFSGADLIVVFEDSYQQYESEASSQQLRNSLSQLASKDINQYGRQNFAYMFNGIPSTWSQDQLKGFVDGTRDGAGYIFLTDVDLNMADIYAQFGSDWKDFVDVV